MLGLTLSLRLVGMIAHLFGPSNMQISEKMRDEIEEIGSAKCRPLCTTTSYLPSVSYGAISQINAQQLLVSDAAKVEVIRERLRNAKEAEARLKPRMLEADE